jgi:hypothetical protein
MSRTSCLAFAATLALVGCDGKRSTPGPGSGAAAGTAARPSDGYAPAGTRPVNPRRPEPPPSMTPLAVGAEAPAIALTDHTGAAWTLAGSLAKVQRVVLVFYRGDW